MTTDLTPLEDPDYKPQHPPVDGRIPDVVIRWGKASQIRWFERFRPDLDPRESLSAYWVTEHHRGACCGSCYGEYEDGWQGGGVMMDGYCCCRDSRGKWLA